MTFAEPKSWEVHIANLRPPKISDPKSWHAHPRMQTWQVPPPQEQLLLYSERKVIIYRKLMIQLDTRRNVSSHHGIPLSAIKEKILIAKSTKT